LFGLETLAFPVQGFSLLKDHFSLINLKPQKKGHSHTMKMTFYYLTCLQIENKFILKM